MTTDYYSVLNLTPTSSREQIRARFFELARSRHPDLFAGTDKEKAENEFQAITEAFNVLTDAERRRKHDQELANPKPSESAGDPRQMAKVFLQRGASFYKKGEYLDAAAEFERATRADSESAKAWYSLALASARVESLRSKGMSAIAQACELDTMNGSYLKLAGRLFLQGGMPLRAERYYRLAQKWLVEDDEVRDALSRLQKR